MAKRKRKVSSGTSIVRAPAGNPIVIRQQSAPLARRRAAVGQGLTKARKMAIQNKNDLVSIGAAAILGYMEAKGHLPDFGKKLVNSGVAWGAAAKIAGHFMKSDTLNAAGSGMLAVGAYEYAKEVASGKPSLLGGEMDGDLDGDLDGEF